MTQSSFISKELLTQIIRSQLRNKLLSESRCTLGEKQNETIISNLKPHYKQITKG